MSEVFKGLQKGLQDAIEYQNGNHEKAKSFFPKEINLKQLREKIGFSQSEFSKAFGISLRTLQQWEQGSRKPRGASLVLLNLIEKDSKKILSLLGYSV